MTVEHVPAFATYRLLTDTLRRLQESEGNGLALRFFEMRLMDQCGFRPELGELRGLRRAFEGRGEPACATERRDGLPRLRCGAAGLASVVGQRAEGVAFVATRAV